ncbi:LysR family transcriptional regulator [Vulgatibacter sp.]|uniref:LysR family transcriptional regulator n=1 Tax=Vulgatibacter sp. TaxID=1971226 RepID=UPI0035658B80
MFDWSDLRIFLAVHRTGSFSAAARQLRINATTVGRRIEALEAALGAALFDRMPDGLRPTEAATEIRVHAESMEAQAFAIERKLGGRELAGGVVLRRELWLVLHPQLRRAPLVRAVADHLTEAIEARATLLAGEAA